MNIKLFIVILTVCAFCFCDLSAQCKPLIIESKDDNVRATTKVVKKGPYMDATVTRSESGCLVSNSCSSKRIKRTISRLQKQAKKRRKGNLRKLPTAFNDKHYSIVRKENLDQALKATVAGTKDHALLLHARERLSLDEIHEAQRYILEHGKKNIGEYEKQMNILTGEFKRIAPVLEEIEDFPYVDETTNIFPVLIAIRNGEIHLADYRGKSCMKILLRIQDLQKKKLIEYQKQFLEEKF